MVRVVVAGVLVVLVAVAGVGGVVGLVDVGGKSAEFGERIGSPIRVLYAAGRGRHISRGAFLRSLSLVFSLQPVPHTPLLFPRDGGFPRIPPTPNSSPIYSVVA